jgi:hypothetical protein
MTVKTTTNPDEVCTREGARDDWFIDFVDLEDKVAELYCEGENYPNWAEIPLSAISQYLSDNHKQRILEVGLDLSTFATLEGLYQGYLNALIVELEEMPTVPMADAAQMWEDNFAGMIERLKEDAITEPDSEIGAVQAVLYMDGEEQVLFRDAILNGGNDWDNMTTLAGIKEAYMLCVTCNDPDDDDLDEDDNEDN